MSRRHTGIGPREPQQPWVVNGVLAHPPTAEVATKFPSHAIKPETAVAELAIGAATAAAVLAAGAAIARKIVQRV